MKNVTKLWIILSVALMALIAQFVFNNVLVAKVIINIVGILVSCSMFIGMIKTLKSGKYGVDLLAITAIIATLLVGEYWAAMIVLIMLVGGDSLEDYATGKANKELKALLNNSPDKAHRIVGNNISDINVDEVKIGDILIVKPGELVPVDGRVIEGSGYVNESSLTGESKPIEKQVNDNVMSGSLNGDTLIKIKAEKLAQDSQYQKLIKLVKQAENEPSNFVRMADKYALPFTIIAYVIAGIAWAISKDPVRFAEVLVVASPCPLILAAPVAMVAGMSRASRNGIVVKSGNVLEKLAMTKTVTFDKTGTITQGSLKINEIVSLNSKYSKTDILRFIVSTEQNSNHILARSIIDYAKKKQVKLLQMTNLKENVGNGIEGEYEQDLIKVGKLSYVDSKRGSSLHKINETCVYISINNQLAGYITFKDIVRPEAAKTMTLLKKLNINNLEMLTGDKENIAIEIANKVGITKTKFELLPSDKIDIIKAIPSNLRPVVMVGDGVNDAPALAIADVGIAMGAHGSTAASEAADVVILKDDLLKVAKSIVIARDTMKISRQSVLIGIIICIVLMLIACTGILPAILGALCQELVDTVSILWSLKARGAKSND